MLSRKTMLELNRPGLPEMRAGAKIPVTVVLENIRSGLNIGSVFRTADAFNMEKILLAGFSVAPPHKEILKTALDATESVPWARVEDLAAALILLKEKGYHIAAVEQVHGSIPLDQFDFSEKQPLVLVFGNEVSGVSEATLGLCDSAIEIPQSGIKHSLNIAVCAGIVLWESYVQLNSFKNRL